MAGKGSVGLAAVCLLALHVHTVVTASSENQWQALIQSFLRDRREDAVAGSQGDSPVVRVRRAAYTNRGVNDFNEDEKKLIVDKHNSLRAEQGSSDMNYMYWDPNLENFAKAWVQRCSFSHSPQNNRENVGNFSYAGENLYAGTDSYDPVRVIQLWYDEVVDYNYQANTCNLNKVCGHYTQVVWANTHAVGCSVKYCDPLGNSQVVRKGFLVSCNYGPGGNIRGQKPYEKGSACTNCGNNRPYCVQKLCARVPVVGEPGTGGQTTAGPGGGQPSLTVIGCSSLSLLICWSVITWFWTQAFLP